MSSTTRILTLGKIAEDEGRIIFKITSQSHRGNKFYYINSEKNIHPDPLWGSRYPPGSNEGDEGNFFIASNGLTLKSHESPEIVFNLYTNIFYVRGSFEKKDNVILVCTKEEWKMITDAVTEYCFQKTSFAHEQIEDLIEELDFGCQKKDVRVLLTRVFKYLKDNYEPKKQKEKTTTFKCHPSSVLSRVYINDTVGPTVAT